MEQIIAPATRIVDTGLNNINPFDYERAASSALAPIASAVETGNANSNQFLLNQINNDKALELARQKNQMQIQREKMSDDRATRVAQLATKSHMDLLTAQNAFKDVQTAKANYRQIGGEDLPMVPGESGAAYLARLTDAFKTKMVDNIKQDSLAHSKNAADIQKQNDYINDPRNQGALVELQKVMSSPAVVQASRAAQREQFPAWLNKVAGVDSETINAAIKANPGREMQVLKQAGLGAAFRDFANQTTLATAQATMKATGHPATAQVAGIAAAKANIQELYRRDRSVDMMGSANGRQIQKPWSSSSRNAADLYDSLSKDPSQAISFDPSTRNWVATPNPSYKAPVAQPGNNINPPMIHAAAPAPAAAPMPGYDAQGRALNTAPLAVAGRNFALGFDVPTIAEAHQSGIMTDADVATARASNPGFWSGAASAPGYWVRAAGSLFDSNIDPMNAIQPGNARYAPLPLPQRPQLTNNIVAPQVMQQPTPAVAQRPNNNVFFAPALPTLPAQSQPAYQPFLAPPSIGPLPQGATISPDVLNPITPPTSNSEIDRLQAQADAEDQQAQAMAARNAWLSQTDQ